MSQAQPLVPSRHGTDSTYTHSPQGPKQELQSIQASTAKRLIAGKTYLTMSHETIIIHPEIISFMTPKQQYCHDPHDLLEIFFSKHSIGISIISTLPYTLHRHALHNFRFHQRPVNIFSSLRTPLRREKKSRGKEVYESGGSDEERGKFSTTANSMWLHLLQIFRNCFKIGKKISNGKNSNNFAFFRNSQMSNFSISHEITRIMRRHLSIKSNDRTRH